MLVSDVMRTIITLFTPSTTFREALITFIQHNMDSTAVVESADSKKLVGVISIHDLIAKMVPDYLEIDTRAALFESQELFQKALMEVADVPIGEFMTTDVVTVHPNHSLIEVAALISKNNLRSVPVVDEKDGITMVGYISRRDIRWAMGKLLMEHPKK